MHQPLPAADLERCAHDLTPIDDDRLERDQKRKLSRSQPLKHKAGPRTSIVQSSAIQPGPPTPPRKETPLCAIKVGPYGSLQVYFSCGSLP
jgi:hypothetical protein